MLLFSRISSIFINNLLPLQTDAMSDNDTDSTSIRWIRLSGGLEKTRVIVDATSRDPSEHIQRRETTVRVTYGQKTARAALKIGRAFEELGEPEDTGEENIRRKDTGLATGLVASNDKVVDGNALDLVPPNSAAVSSASMPKKRRMPKKRQTWKAQRLESRRQPARKLNPAKLSKTQLLDAKGYHALHSQSTVQGIKDFLSNVSRAYGNESPCSSTRNLLRTHPATKRDN
jgi:hypothetical protein